MLMPMQRLEMRIITGALPLRLECLTLVDPNCFLEAPKLVGINLLMMLNEGSPGE